MSGGYATGAMFINVGFESKWAGNKRPVERNNR